MPHYIDKADLQKRLTEYLLSCEEAEKDGKPIPPVPSHIGIDLENISNGLASSRRFNRYPYADELAREGVLQCLLKIRNYEFRKYDNPLGYFTQLCWFKFLNYDKAEYEEKLAIQRSCDEMAVEVFNLSADDVDARNEHLEFMRTKLDQCEMNRETTDKRFVHRMKTARPVKEKKAEPKKHVLVFDPK